MWPLAVVFVGLLINLINAFVGTPAVGAQSGGTEGADPSACAAELGFEIVVRGAEVPLGVDVSFNVSTPRRLAQPVGPGDVVVSGVVADPGHVPFDAEHQTHEQIRVALLSRTGQLLATTAPTMDLADDATSAFFRLPSVAIDEPAHFIRVVHGGTAESLNSLTVPCINVELVDRASPPADRWRDSVCPAYLNVTRETRCGFLAVPERRDVANSRMIQVAAVVVPATSNFSGPSIVSAPPLFFFEGGPGGPGSNVASLLARVAPFTSARDLVVMDQRGTGLSMPNLSCEDAPGETDVDVLTREIRRCQARLARERVDLAGFTTKEAAADAIELRQALGYRNMDLLGASYGTTVAMTVMAQDPAGVRSVIVDSVLPPAVNFVADGPAAIHRQLDDLVARCQIQDSCREAFPRLRADLIRAFERVERDPVPYPAHLRGEVARPAFDGVALMDFLSRSLVDTNTPAFIHALATQDRPSQAAALASLLPTAEAHAASQPAPGEPPDQALPPPTSLFATGLYLSVICAEEAANPEAFLPEPATRWSPTMDRLFDEVGGEPNVLRFCELWDVDPAPGSVALSRPASAARSVPIPDVPLLIVGAQDDDRTPISWVVGALDASSRTNLVVFERGGHVMLGNRCANDIMGRFLRRPFDRVDQSCVAAQPRVVYRPTLPGLTGSGPADPPTPPRV